MHVPSRMGEAALSLVLAGLGAAVAVGGARMPLGTLSLPGPGFFPLALGVLLGVAGVAWSAVTLARGGSDPVSLGGWRPWSTLAVLAAAALAFEPVGAPLTLALMLAALFRILGDLGLARALAYGVVASAVAYLVFTRLLGVGLPAGVLDGLLFR